MHAKSLSTLSRKSAFSEIFFIRAQLVELGIVQDEKQKNRQHYFEPIEEYSHAKPIDNVKIIQFGSPLVFLNAEHFKKQIFEETQDHSKNLPETNGNGAEKTDICLLEKTIKNEITTYQPDASILILDLKKVTSVDYTGAKTLIEVYHTLKKKNIALLYAEADSRLISILKKFCSPDEFHKIYENFYPSIYDALDSNISFLKFYLQSRDTSKTSISKIPAFNGPNSFKGDIQKYMEEYPYLIDDISGVFGETSKAAMEAMKLPDSVPDVDTEFRKVEKAKPEQIQGLLEHLGGFQLFSNLPTEIKTLIVCDYCDYKVRFMLKYVNKQCHQICSKKLEHYDLLRIQHYDPVNTRRFHNQLTDHIWWVEIERVCRRWTPRGTSTTAIENNFKREFIQKIDGVLVTNGNAFFPEKSEKRKLYMDGRKVRDMAFQYFLYLLKSATVKRLDIYMNKLMHEEKVALLNVLESHPANVNSNLKLLPCRKMRLQVDDYNTTEWIVDRLPERMDVLVVGGFTYERRRVPNEVPHYPHEFFDKPQIITCKNLDVYERCEIEPEQFLKLETNCLRFSNITTIERCLNVYIKHWSSIEIDKLVELKFWRPSNAPGIQLALLLDGLNFVDFDEYCANGDKWLRNFKNGFTMKHGHQGTRHLIMPNKKSSPQRAVLSIHSELIFFVAIMMKGLNRYIMDPTQVIWKRSLRSAGNL